MPLFSFATAFSIYIALYGIIMPFSLIFLIASNLSATFWIGLMTTGAAAMTIPLANCGRMKIIAAAFVVRGFGPLVVIALRMFSVAIETSDFLLSLALIMELFFEFLYSVKAFFNKLKYNALCF
jgi:hypothetical protein